MGAPVGAMGSKAQTTAMAGAMQGFATPSGTCAGDASSDDDANTPMNLWDQNFSIPGYK